MTIILAQSYEDFQRLSHNDILTARLIGYKQENGLISVKKNRFNGMIGTYTQKGWEKLVEQTKEFFQPPELENKVEPIARMLAAEKMGLIEDKLGENQPYELWSQCIPEARKFLGLQ